MANTNTYIDKIVVPTGSGSDTITANFIDSSSGYMKDVQVNGTSITSNGTANLITNTAYNASSNKIATMADVGSAGGGTVTSVGVSNATNGGLTVSGSPVTASGTITVGHSNVLTNAQTTQAVYPITIDKNGHVASYGGAVTIPDTQIFWVTGTITNPSTLAGTTDKSASEIYAAVQAGKLPIIKIVNEYIYLVATLSAAGPSYAAFEYDKQNDTTIPHALIEVQNSAFTVTLMTDFVENESATIAGTSPITVSGTGEIANNSTITISLAGGYGDTENPYASKTANYVLAAPNGSAGTPSFRALVSADIPALGNIQNSGALQTNDVAIATGDKLVVTDSSDSNKVAKASLSFDTTNTSDFLRKDGTWATVSGGSSTDVQVNGTSITSGGVANIATEGTYNSSSNKIATMNDLRVFEIPVYYDGYYVTNLSWTDITNAWDDGKLLYVSVDRTGDTYDAGEETYANSIIYCNLAEAYTYDNGSLTFVGMSEENEPITPQLFSVVVLSPGANDSVDVMLYYTDVYHASTASTATTATNANNINNSQFTNTSYVTYYLPFLNGYTAGNKKPYTHNGAALYTRVGTASAVGGAYLRLGNTTNSGTAGNMRGGIDLYAQSGAYYTRIQTTNTLTGNNTLTLPTGTGTIALTSDIPTVPGILSGTTAPTSSQGSNGDIYIRY